MRLTAAHVVTPLVAVGALVAVFAAFDVRPAVVVLGSVSAGLISFVLVEVTLRARRALRDVRVVVVKRPDDAP